MLTGGRFFTSVSLLCVLLLIVPSGTSTTQQSTDQTNGGWFTPPEQIVAAEGPCNIEKHNAGDLTQKEFEQRFAFTEPVIIENFDNSEFRRLCSRDQLLSNFGEVTIQLSTANTYSYSKVSTTVREYFDQYLRPQNIDKRGNDTYYLFGDIDRDEWDPLLKHYLKPPWKLPDHSAVLSFGIGGAGTGVPFHMHGPVYAEVIYGRKRWFLYAPEDKPEFDPDMSTMQWFLTKYPTLPYDKKPLECVLGPGQVLYLPDRWWHATLNVEVAVFMSTFLSP